MASCPNLSNPKIKKDFEELNSILGEDLSYLIWNINNNHIDKSSNGNTSELFTNLLDITKNREEAIRLKSKIYLESFKKWFGKSKNIDVNGEPLIINNYFVNDKNEKMLVYSEEGSILLSEGSNFNTKINKTILSKTSSVKEFAKTNNLDKVETPFEKRGDKTYNFVFETGDEYSISIDNKLSTPTEIYDLGFNSATTLAYYNKSNNNITLTTNFDKLNNYDKTRILAHETIHGIITNKINNLSGINKSIFESKINLFIAEMKANDTLMEFDIVKRTMKSIDKGGYQELITYALTDPEFAKALNSIILGEKGEINKKTFWEKLKELILSIISDDYTLLDKLTDILDAHIQIFDKNTPTTNRNSLFTEDVNKVVTNDIERKLNELSNENAKSLNQKLQEEPDLRKNKLFLDVSKKLKGFLETVGIEYSNVDSILDSNGNSIDAISKADIIAKTIEIIENRRDFTTLPEEAAHVYVKLLGKDNPLYQTMMDKITRFNIYNSTKNQYSNLEDYNEEKIKEEAIGKLISINILNEQNLIDSELNQDLFSKWWVKVWNWIKNALGKLKSNEFSPFVESAKNILSGSIDGLMSLEEVIDANTDPIGLSYYQLAEEDITNKEELIKNLNASSIVRDFENGGYKTISGKKILTTVKEYVKYKHAKDTDFKINTNLETTKTNYSLKADYIYLLNNSIMEAIVSGMNKEELLNSTEKFASNIAQQLLNDEDYKKANERENNKFFNINTSQWNELVDGMFHIYNQIQENKNRISKYSNQQGEVKIYTGLSIYSEKEDLAGNVDVLAVYPNGSVGIYNYSAVKYITNKKGDVIKEKPISSYKLDEFDLLMYTTKRILSEQYGITNFAESRILPINIQLNYKVKDVILPTSGFKTIEIGNAEERKYLEQIPSSDELTEDPDVNKALIKMFSLRAKLKEKLKQNPNQNEVRINLVNVDSSIKELQLRRNIKYIYNEVVRMYRHLEERESRSKDMADYLTISDLNDILEFSEVYENLADNDINLIKDLDSDNKLKVSGTYKILREIRKKALNKLIERINEDSNIDITSDVTETGFLGRLFKQLYDYDQPIFKRMAKLVRNNSENTRQNINKLIEDIESKHAEVSNWASKNKLSLIETFEKYIFNKETGNLISQFKSQYYEDFKKARISKDKKWLFKYTYFDETTFEKNKNSYFELLDKQYDDIDSQERKDYLKAEFIKKYDVREKDSNAYYNTSNYYIKLKEDFSEYFSDEWLFLLKDENKALKDYYDTYISYNKHFNELVGKKISKGHVAEIRQDTIDRFTQVGLSAFGDLIPSLINSMELREYDISKRALDPITNKPIPVIPLYFTDKLRQTLTSKEKKEIIDGILSEGIELDSYLYKIETNKRILNAEFKKGRKFKSYDLTRNLVLFAESVYTNKFANDTEDIIRALQNIMNSDKISTKQTNALGIIKKESGEILKTVGMSPEDINTFDKFVKMYWYGLATQNKDKEITIPFLSGEVKDKEGNILLDGKKHSMNKLIQGIMKYTTVTSMAFKIPLAFGNIIGLLSNAYSTAAEGMNFNQTQLNKSFSLMIKKDKKAIWATKYFEVSARDLTREKANDLSANKISKLLTTDNMLILHKKPDDFFDDILLLSMLQNYGLDENNKLLTLNKLPKDSKSLYDLAEIKDNTFIIPGLSDNTEVYNKFRQIVRITSTRIKGSIPEDNKNLVGTNIVGQLLMHYRNWIPGLASQRLRKLSYDEETSQLDVGRFRVIAGEMIRSNGFKDVLKNTINLLAETTLQLPLISRFTKYSIYKDNQNKRASKYFFDKYLAENPDLKGKITLQEYEELRASKLKGFAKELSLLLFMLAMVALTKTIIPDDEEEVIAEYMARNAYLATNRGLLELTFWFDPTSVRDIVKSPVPSFRTVINIWDWAGNTIDVTADLFKDDTNPYKAVFSKGKKDKTPIGYRTSGLIPGISALVDFINLYDKPTK